LHSSPHSTRDNLHGQQAADICEAHSHRLPRTRQQTYIFSALCALSRTIAAGWSPRLGCTREHRVASSQGTAQEARTCWAKLKHDDGRIVTCNMATAITRSALTVLSLSLSLSFSHTLSFADSAVASLSVFAMKWGRSTLTNTFRAFSFTGILSESTAVASCSAPACSPYASAELTSCRSASSAVLGTCWASRNNRAHSMSEARRESQSGTEGDGHAHGSRRLR
jgi:hypothetical protein